MSEHRGAVSTEAQNLLKTLRDRGVELSVEGDRLRVVAPRGTVGPELQAAIAAAKADMVAALRAAGGSAVAARDDRLAPVQERVWLYQELEPDSPTYNHTFVVRIEGPLDPARLEAALARVVERHVPLRTRITKSAAGPRRVPASGSVSMGLHDISAVPEADRPAATRSIIRDQQAQPFDLEQGAPVRASLIRSSAEVHDVVITVHHIAIDGISVPRVYGELEAHYRGILLPDLRATYDEYVAEERAYWQEQRIEERVQFWDSYLDGAPHVLELPVDYPANRNASQEGSLLSTNLPAGALGMLKGFAQQERASLFMVLLASYAAALHRATGQRDFLIGTPLHGRHRAEYSDLVGMFVNQAPLRVKVPAGATLRELVRMTRESVLKAMSDREVPFGLLIERLGVKRDAQRTPLFQTMLNVLPLVNLQTDDSDDVRFRLPPTEELIVALDGQAKFDATVYAYERDGELQVAMSYNADRFDRARMEALLDDVAAILQQCASTPDVCPGVLRSTAGPHDRGGIAGPDPDTPEESVASRFARTASRFADRPALIDDEREITYAELYRQVAAIARRLNESVQDADQPLGVLVPHETVLAPAILGALHAGRPYVPLDASYPLERLAYMMRDAGADTILTTRALIERAREISPSARIITIEEAAAAEPVAPQGDADRIAYLLYTSGSTGKPKAVVQLQGNLVRQADRYARALSIQPGDRVALLASISFDASLMDLFGALLNGAAVSPVDPRSDDLPRLPGIVASRQLTVLHVTPTLFRTLRQISGDARFDSIRAVDLGGEAMRPEDIAFFDERFPSDAMLVNSYGPSEHTFALGFPVPRDLRSSEVPIGWPVGDVEALMLNPETGEVDPVSGVLALCSSYGARGYWNNAEATNAAFSTDPARPGRIIYRTGDVVRRRSDGAFVFLHREDHQLKLRGQRVEPAEIETVLRLHPAVGAAAVHAPKNQTGSETLTACVVPASGKDVAVPELIEYCRSRLPAHMVPAAWVVVEALPLTPSGKVDRRSLPTSVETNEGAGRLPRTRTEQVTLDAWQAVLNRDDIGITDDFFSVGGHSLAAVEVVARLRNLLDTDVPLRVVFEHPTIEETAAWIDAHSGTSRASEPIRRLEEGETAPLSFAQERVWLFQKMEPDSATYNVTPIIRLRGRLDRARLATALAGLLERHEALRSTLVEGATGAEQRVHDVPDNVLEVRSIRDLADADREHERQRIVRSQNARAFDLARDVPFRAMLLEIDDDVCDLVLTFHHVASDYTSVRTFMRELHTLYAGGMLPELPVRYRDYTAWERAAWSDARLNDEVSFWSDYLDDAPRVLDFPVDRPRTASTGYSGEFIEILIPEAAAAPLLDLAQQERVSVFPLLLAVFGAVLHRHTGQRDLIIGAPATGRSRAELQGVVGMFINQIPVRLQVAPARTLRELVRDARTSALAALTHQDMPFPRLVELLGGTRETGRTPLFQVMLNVLPAGLDAQLPAANGVEFVQPDVREFRSLIDLHSKYDFTLYAMQREGGLHMGLVYNRDLFDHARMEGVAQDVERLLLEGAARPDRHLDELWPAPPARPAAPKRAFSTMPEALRHIALERPADVAIDEPDRQVTWRELLEAVERTARLLAADGSAATGEPVGVLATHGSPAIIGLLGALTAGRPYVPLDPTYPEERLRFMIRDAGVGVVLASPDQGALSERLTEGLGSAVLLGTTPPDDAALPEPPRPDAVAYLLYTSGSTGRPKAVVQTHGNLLEQASRYADAIHLTPADRLAWMASVSFDASVMDVYGGLLGGAVLVPIEARSTDLSTLPELVADRHVTVLHLTPTVLRSIGRITPDAAFPTARMLVLGGEPVRAPDVEYFDRMFGDDAQLYNLYGASEHSFSFGHVVDRSSRSAEVPIGLPIGDVDALLLDEHGHEDPVRGELTIRSAHTGLRYWNSSAASERAFLPDPSHPGRVLYRTGDLARRRTDGRYVALGRVDDQVKVRGHRIEPAEVEEVLRRHPAIADAAVHAPAREDGERVLVACYTRQPDAACDTVGLKQWCEERLPSYLVPSIWLEVSAIPRTPSGKVDRRSLPAEAAHRADESLVRAPRTGSEQRVLEVWESVLRHTGVSVTDDFFAVGGHSLAAVEVVARLRDLLDADVPLRVVFEHPTIQGMAAWIDAHSETSTAAAIRLLEADETAPLSYAQERVWLFQKLEPDSATYNATPIVQLRGPLERDRLVQALAQLLERHEALRSTLVEGEDGPEQRVQDVPARVLEIRSVRDLPATEREQERRRIIRSQSTRPFDLASEIPFRALLLVIDDDVFELVLTFHHVASDYTSVRTFVRELHTLYAGGELAPLPVRYRDYTAWERAAWDDARLSSEADFWSGYLKEAPPALDFPTDRPRTNQTGYSGEFVEIRLPAERATAVFELAQQERVSVFPLLLAIFGAVLHRHTGERDLVIGAPATGRSRAELQGVVGMFVNQVPVRLQVPPARTLRELVRAARTSALAALSHQDMPFPRLLDILGIAREAGRTPLFQVMLNVLPPGLDEPLQPIGELAFVQGEVREMRSMIDLHSKYDFTLYAMQRAGGLHLGLVYNRELFDAARMASVAHDIERLLLDGTARPDLRLDELWPEPSVPAPVRAIGVPAATMPEALRTRALQRPSDIAVEEPEHSLSWEQLLAEVEQTARLLAADAPQTPHRPVGIVASHGSPSIIGMLGALTAGRPYVPLDPTYPDERLRFMLHDAGIETVLASPDRLEQARELVGDAGRILVLGATPPDDATLPAAPRPEAVAYLLYTSGSTGRPKAIVQTHGNLLEQASRYAAAIGLSEADRLAWMASVSFDATVMDVYGGLLGGAVLCPIEARSTDLSRLPDILNERRVSVLHLTPTVLRSIDRLVPGARFPTVRTLVLGGEPVRPEHVAFFDHSFPSHAVLFNLYGASEHSFSFGASIPRTLRSTEIPIGHPVGDVEARLITQEGEEDSVIGELVVRSAHNAAGYWNAPEMSERVFVPDAGDDARTWYRTGDIMRRRPDGQLVFVRRADARMKVRGHRIEAYEIESMLKEHESVAEAAVHAPATSDGDSVLTACIVAIPGRTCDVATLIEWCRRMLPSFMVPTAWTFVPELPRTPSGKVNRKALPAGDATQSASADHPGARDAEETELLGIWQEVLGLEQIAIHDDFFALGGHSLNATEVVARVRDALGVEIPLRQFFDNPTIAHCAEWVRNHVSAAPGIPPLKPTPATDDAPLSFSQERLWFLQQLDRNATAYNMASAGLIEGPLDLERFRRAFDQVAMRQESLRTTIRTVQGRPVQVVAPAPIHEFEVLDLSQHGELALDHAQHVARDRLGAPYDLERGPLFRVMAIRVRADQHVIAVGAHHTVSDMWSNGVLARELRDAYLGRPTRELPVSYRDYAIWQRSWLDGDVLHEQVEYWRQQLAGSPKLELPTDHPRPVFFSFGGDVIDSDLSPELRDAIRQLAVRHRVTPFMVLLAAYNVLLSTYSGQDDIVVGVPIAGRRAAATEQLIGTFVNTLVHRNDTSGDPTFAEMLQRTRSTALAAYANQDVPFELLVKELEPPRDTSRGPFFQVLFNVANVRMSPVDPNAPSHSALALHRDAAQFDLSISVGRSGLRLTYNTALFRRATAQRILGHYLEILNTVVAHPDRRVSEVRSPASPDKALLTTWNATDTEPRYTSMMDAFAAAASRRPDEKAVVSPTGAFTYAELLDYAQRVTAALQLAGIGPGDRVAILMERSREMLGALLGILGSGAAYIPVDPAYPEARVRYVLEDSAARMVVTHRGIHARLGIVTPVLDLDAWTPPAPAAFVDVAPAQPAYVIYTSGSTGKPKGVEVSHGSMANFLFAMQERPGITQDDVLLAVTTISFDIAVLELYLPLIAGARVVIASEEEALDGRRLVQRMDDEGVTLMQATPATWKLLIAAGWQGKSDLRVLCGGEPLPRILADDMLDRVAELWNMYGPTETTVWSTLDRVERDDAITVGRPIANTTCYVLDDDMRLKPIGVPGELWIGGAGVANGYVNRPDLTAERFVDSPFREGERIYRTGDLVRWRHDGRLEHLGRLDNQVKIRGFRIELGEVESALTSHSAVRDAVAAARDDRLVGYVVFEEGQTATTADLRSWVASTLPPYMVPSIVMPLDALPLTPNGKVDRKALPEPEAVVDDTPGWQAPTDPTAQAIAAIWSELLELDRIGVDDRFFEIGGHSLLAMEVVARIEERLGVRPEPRSLFFMTLGELAESVRPGQPA